MLKCAPKDAEIHGTCLCLLLKTVKKKKKELHGFLYFSLGNLSKDSCRAKFIKENVIFLFVLVLGSILLI